MPETDILNKEPLWTDDIQDSMCPDYGFGRERPSTLLSTKAVGGSPWTRETENTGHSFSLSWLSRSWACVQRLKQYYERYEDGYCTIIDWDGGGRHYVGRFTTSPKIVEAGNGMWAVQDLTFEEMPQARMVQYPSDWDNDAIVLYPLNDFSEQKLATFGEWGLNVRTIQGNPASTMDNGGTANDWAQHEYLGYGFQLYLMQGPEFGQCQVYLDGVEQSAPGGGPTFDCYAAADIGPQLVLQLQNVSLDIHRVKVIVLGTKNVAASAPTISWHSLKVMR